MGISTNFRYIPIIGWRFSNSGEANAIANQVERAKTTTPINNNKTDVYINLTILGGRTQEATNLLRLETARLLTKYDLTLFLKPNDDASLGEFAMRTTVVVGIIKLLQEMAASKYKPRLTLLVGDQSVNETCIHLIVSIASHLGLLRNVETGAITPSLVEFVRSCNQLDYLGFSANPIHSQAEADLRHDMIDAIKLNQSVKTLYLKGTEILPDQVALLLRDTIRSNHTIRHLSVAYSFDDTKRWVFQSIRNHPSIQYLTLTFLSSDISPSSADILAEEMSNVLSAPDCRIQELEVRGESWSKLKFPVELLFKCFGENSTKSVKVLHLNHTDLSTEGLDQLLCHLWKWWPNIKVLNLSDNLQIKSFEFRNFFAQQREQAKITSAPVPPSSRLEELILSPGWRYVPRRPDRDPIAPLRAMRTLLQAFPRLHSFGIGWKYTALWENIKELRREIMRRKMPYIMSTLEDMVLPNELQFLADQNQYRPIFQQVNNVPARRYPNLIIFVTKSVLKLDPNTEPVLKRQSDMIYQLLQSNPSLPTQSVCITTQG